MNEAKKEKRNETNQIILVPFVHYQYNTNNLIFQEFVPNKDLFYFFFTEKSQPKQCYINNNALTQFGLYDALDIQRYRYYPGTTSIFTFIGFSNPQQREEAKLRKKINRSVYENVIYNFPYEHKTEELFTPDENLFYVYFKEIEQSIKQCHLKDISEYYEFKDIIDMQKGYKIKKEDKNYYSFYVFGNAKLRSEAI